MDINTKTKKRDIKHNHITEKLFQDIVHGHYAPGEKIPTEEELAKVFGASRPTVGRALRELQRKGIIKRRQGAGSFVSFTGTNKEQSVGILMGFSQATAERGIFGSLLSEISNACSLNNFNLILKNFPSDNNEETIIRHARKSCADFVRQKVNSVVFMPLDLEDKDANLNIEIVDTFERAGVTVVLLDRDIYSEGKRSKYDRVGTNNYQASFAMTEHLLDLGYKDIDLVTIKYRPSTVCDRIEGYEKAMARHGLNHTSSRIHSIHPMNASAINAYLDQMEAEAILCTNDSLAALFMREILARGVQIPEDVKIVGFDDSPIASLLPVGLTTMRQPVQAIAEEVLRTIKTRLEYPDLPARDISISSTLVVRDSCGAKLDGRKARTAS